jgi:hypothetical protein
VTDQLASLPIFGGLPLLATNARKASHPGTCAICQHAITPRADRVATLPDGGTAHIACIGATTPRSR